jgi:uncharacterized 2Fe-2S/4Fe-4S cluster protein (DUF4445 family)
MVVVETGTKIARAAALVGINVGLPCGGQGRCGRCTVVVKTGSVDQRSKRRFSLDDQSGEYALACQDTVRSDTTIYVPPQRIERRLQTDKMARKMETPAGYEHLRDQSLRRFVVSVTAPTLDDQLDDWSRLKRALSRQHRVENLTTGLPVLRQVSRALRQGNWMVTLVVEMDRWDGPPDSPRLVDILPGESVGPIWGVAIDIGTTTNHALLVNLVTGEVYSHVSDYNGQIARGEDVISRIIYASRGTDDQRDRYLFELQTLVLQTLNGLLEQAAQQAGVHTANIYRATVAGNSTMLHLFAGLQPESIRLMPFVTTVNQIPTLQAAEVGLQICPSASVDCLPGVASYVGSDITAGVLGSGMGQDGKLSLFIDVGTNGEMVLGDGSWLIACACSAGPAFEGAGVAHGMRATQGAIEDIWVNSATYEPTTKVIGPEGEPPGGICGSGLISLLAEMLVTGIVDKSGNINTTLQTERTRLGPHGGEYVVAWGYESASRQDIVITDVDIDNLMRAKAAIYAGFSVLATSAGLSISDVEQILIGGAFGQYLNIEKAVQIGLLPEAPWERFLYLGNTSLRGAYLALLSRHDRQKIADIAAGMTYLELSADNRFFEEFNAALFLPHTEESRFPSMASRQETLPSQALTTTGLREG